MMDAIKPTPDWTFDEWCLAAGVTNNTQLIDVAIELGLTSANHPWSPQRVSEWRNGRRNRQSDERDTRLDYESALTMICVLREIARQNNRPIFDNANFLAHCALFLRSTIICKHPYWASPEDLCKKCGVSQVAEEFVPPLISKVQPSPPYQLTGREADLSKILAQGQHSPLTLISGIAGDGKTALAWFAAQEALHAKYFTGVEWVTDKRYQVDFNGNLIALAQGADSDQRFLVKIFREMAKRFQWHDVMSAIGTTLVERGADKLRKGTYLLVIDNLETVDRHDELLRELMTLIYPRNHNDEVRSRILVTSRHEIRASQYGQVRIEGLSEADSRHLLQQLHHTLNPVSLSEAQEIELAAGAGGNPLFLQLAFNSYTNNPSSEHWRGLIETLTQGKLASNSPSHAWQVLEHSFSKLDAAACWLAQHAAKESLFVPTPIQAIDLQATWQQQFGHLKQFDLTLDILIRHRILNVTLGGGYTMHSLVRAYWLGYGENNQPI